MTPSAISQRIKALETSVGRELVIDDAARALAEEGGRELPVLALAVNADSLSTWLPAALAAVDPPVCFDLRRADETRTAELLRDGTVTAAVTALADPVPGCTVQSLGRMRYRPRASPAFIERWFRDGVIAAILARAPVVVFDRTDVLQDRYLRRAHGVSCGRRGTTFPGRGPSQRRSGSGWGMVPDLQAREGDGLVELDPDGAVDVHLHWQQWRLRSATVKRVADAVRAEAALMLEQLS